MDSSFTYNNLLDIEALEEIYTLSSHFSFMRIVYK